MSYQQAYKSRVLRGEFKTDQCPHTTAKDKCWGGRERSKQSRRIDSVYRDLVSLCPDRRAAGQAATVVSDDSELDGKLIGQSLRALSVTGAALEDQQYRP
jgi:hypothetical protein